MGKEAKQGVVEVTWFVLLEETEGGFIGGWSCSRGALQGQLQSLLSGSRDRTQEWQEWQGECQ